MKKKIILYVLILLIVVISEFVILKTVFKNGGNSNNEFGEFTTKSGSKKVFIDSIETNIAGSNGMKYTKIGLTIENLLAEDVKTETYLFQITDRDKNVIAICHNKASDDDNAFPDIISGSGKTSGNIYCETEREDVAILKISYVSGAKYSDDGMIDFDEEILNVIFNK